MDAPFKPGDKVRALMSGYNPEQQYRSASEIFENAIYTVKKVKKDKSFTHSGYSVFLEENTTGWCASFFKIDIKYMHDINFNNKLDELINE